MNHASHSYQPLPPAKQASAKKSSHEQVRDGGIRKRTRLGNPPTRAIDAFDGELPNSFTEQTIIEAYELHPEAVAKAISQVAADFTKGTIRTGWGVTKNRAERILSPPSNPTAKTGLDKERAVQRAEQWMKTTGAHYDRQTEVLEELFGDQGRLHSYAQIETIEVGRNAEGHAIYALSEPTGDLALVDRMTHLWDQARPAGHHD